MRSSGGCEGLLSFLSLPRGCRAIWIGNSWFARLFLFRHFIFRVFCRRIFFLARPLYLLGGRGNGMLGVVNGRRRECGKNTTNATYSSWKSVGIRIARNDYVVEVLWVLWGGNGRQRERRVPAVVAARNTIHHLPDLQVPLPPKAPTSGNVDQGSSSSKSPYSNRTQDIRDIEEEKRPIPSQQPAPATASAPNSLSRNGRKRVVSIRRSGSGVGVPQCNTKVTKVRRNSRCDRTTTIKIGVLRARQVQSIALMESREVVVYSGIR